MLWNHGMEGVAVEDGPVAHPSALVAMAVTLMCRDLQVLACLRVAYARNQALRRYCHGSNIKRTQRVPRSFYLRTFGTTARNAIVVWGGLSRSGT